MGDLATWVTGIATIALFVIGFIQIRNEREARIKSEKEAELLKARIQAEHIAAWEVKVIADKKHIDWLWIAVSNQSSQPVYQAIVAVVLISHMGKPSNVDKPQKIICIGIVPPGQGYAAVEYEFGGAFRRIGVEVGFTDSVGRNWLRKADGELSEINTSIAEYYEVDLPANWQGIMSELPEEMG